MPSQLASRWLEPPFSSIQLAELGSGRLIFLEYTLPDFAANLAVDELLLGQAERNDGASWDGASWDGGAWDREVLRIWHPDQPAVVVGRGSKWREEVDVAACQERGIPVFRRPSGGAAIVTGPGCWMYSVVLGLGHRQHLRDLGQAHRYVMSRLRDAVAPLVMGRTLQVQGICDLVVAGRKCSGNSLRVGRQSFLYHGTLLVDFDLDLIGACLRTPPRQPDYRQGRPHEQFVGNLPWDRRLWDRDGLWSAWRQNLCRQWKADGAPADWLERHCPRAEIERLVGDKYATADWNLNR